MKNLLFTKTRNSLPKSLFMIMLISHLLLSGCANLTAPMNEMNKASARKLNDNSFTNKLDDFTYYYMNNTCNLIDCFNNFQTHNNNWWRPVNQFKEGNLSWAVFNTMKNPGLINQYNLIQAPTINLSTKKNLLWSPKENKAVSIEDYINTFTHNNDCMAPSRLKNNTFKFHRCVVIVPEHANTSLIEGFRYNNSDKKRKFITISTCHKGNNISLHSPKKNRYMLCRKKGGTMVKALPPTQETNEQKSIKGDKSIITTLVFPVNKCKINSHHPKTTLDKFLGLNWHSINNGTSIFPDSYLYQNQSPVYKSSNNRYTSERLSSFCNFYLTEKPKTPSTYNKKGVCKIKSVSTSKIRLKPGVDRNRGTASKKASLQLDNSMLPQVIQYTSIPVSTTKEQKPEEFINSVISTYKFFTPPVENY